ncbi:glycosyltransferase family 4 protein [Rhizobacter sp. Root404]|jgi:glycosyltransferase involved in cell wall biosynthesis|uniref:glycosyltransferase family 4 protein n=1 Tax=Rhizobacter sp. Root404 TaxID=1736528 RepID=UPI0006FC780C|nr:glycosyltransferase family 4 protein [Rhizobacter sp. Root404]KQW37685.1 glycosyltransferase [Rhizobacter sp. Root404]
MPSILMVAYTNYRRDPRVRREAEALVEAGHRVVFYACRQASEPNREIISGVEVIKLFSFRHGRKSAFGYVVDYASFFLQVFARLTAHPRRYALIHVNNMPDLLAFAALGPRLAGVPVILDIHDLMPELAMEKFSGRGNRMLVWGLKLQERLAGKFATLVLTVEERLKEILSHRGLSPSKIHVLMNLPDEAIFQRAEGPSTRQATRFTVIYHGTLARRLGLDIAIRAVALARQSIPEIEFRIIGDGEERGALVALARELGLADAVRFSDGFVPVDRIPAMIHDAHVGLVPLRISAGTDIMLPTKLLEYVYLGIPCIVPETTTIRRYFDQKMVRFFQADDVDSLASAIVSLHQHPGARVGLARESTARFANVYRWSSQKLAYVQTVERLLRR